MATFNVADEQPDHAERACRVALGFQEAASAVAQAHPGWPRFRVGVHSGMAVAGIVGDTGDREYTVVGDTVNVAARLESVAPPGGVAISDSTRRAAGGAHGTTLGTLSLKGRSDPVEIWLLTSVSPATTGRSDRGGGA
jgi:class 3 adenylate cyclase